MSQTRLLVALRRWRAARAAMRSRLSPAASREYSAACDVLDEAAQRLIRLDDAVSSAETEGQIAEIRRRIATEVGL